MDDVIYEQPLIIHRNHIMSGFDEDLAYTNNSIYINLCIYAYWNHFSCWINLLPTILSMIWHTSWDSQHPARNLCSIYNRWNTDSKHVRGDASTFVMVVVIYGGVESLLALQGWGSKWQRHHTTWSLRSKILTPGRDVHIHWFKMERHLKLV